MSVYDYATDDAIKRRISRRAKRIRSYNLRNRFRYEVMQELYDSMEFDRNLINNIIDMVFSKYLDGGDDD